MFGMFPFGMGNMISFTSFTSFTSTKDGINGFNVTMGIVVSLILIKQITLIKI